MPNNQLVGGVLNKNLKLNVPVAQQIRDMMSSRDVVTQGYNVQS
jgi:hypothetical protein